MLRLGWMVTLGGCGTLALYDGDDPDAAAADDGAAADAVGGDERDPDEDRDGDGVLESEDCDDEDDEVYPGANELCGDDRDADCDGDDCLLWDDDFEADGLGAAWTAGGPAAWQVWVGAAHLGEQCAASGAILDGQSSHLRLTIDAPEGATVSFWHSGSTEATYDTLSFTVDTVEKGVWSGAWTWQEASVTVPRGVHDLVWSYTKDLSITTGQDKVLVDDILIEGGTPL